MSGSRLLGLAIVALAALAWQAQAAVASSGKLTIVKVNEGGVASDRFSFTTTLTPARGDFALAGGEQQTFKVECNASSRPGSCTRTVKPVQRVTELPTPGYDLGGIVCRHRLDGSEPTTASAVDPDTTVDGATIDAKVFVDEWVKCWVTNTPKAPGVALDKTGPGTAAAGSLVPYALQVTNTGGQPFAASSVVVSDPQCASAPALASANGDATPATLDPGETWTYGCSVQTAAGQAHVVNSASVLAIDRFGQDASSSDAVTTALFVAQGSSPQSPGISILPTRQVPGSARLLGPSRCVRAPVVRATVTGREITRVSFYVDGRHVRTLTRPDRRGRWTLATNVRSFGAHRVLATVRFTRASGTSTKTLRISVARCRAAVAQPQFTG